MPGTDKICAVVASPHAEGMRSQLKHAPRKCQILSKFASIGWLSDAEIDRFLRVAGQPKNTQGDPDCHLPAARRRRTATEGASPSSLSPADGDPRRVQLV